MPEVVSDGYNEWERCLRPDCDLEIVRPGKTQCSGEGDGIGCPDNQDELIARLHNEWRKEHQLADELAAGLAESFKLYDEYWPSLMARPGTTPYNKWKQQRA